MAQISSYQHSLMITEKFGNLNGGVNVYATGMAYLSL